MTRSKPIGFMGERTADYLIVPAMLDVLSRPDWRPIPFYYWSDREGCSLAYECGEGVRVRLLAGFSRRPKVKVPGQRSILVKFNRSLFRAARVAARWGAPTVAGVPLVSTFLEVGQRTRIGWFEITGESRVADDVHCQIDLTGLEVCFDKETDSVTGPLGSDRIQTLVQEAPVIAWREMLDAASEIRRASAGGGRFFFAGGRYMPVFWAVRDVGG